jgi:hypothetical protein
MSDNRQNFVIVHEPDTDDAPPPEGLLSRIRTALQRLLPAPVAEAPTRPRLVFAFDATASREPAWATARQVTDALVKALPGELDVALAVHGGSMLHTFTDFTADARTLRDRAAGISCMAGFTRMLPILARSLKRPGVRVIVYIGDVFEESVGRGRRLADELAARGIKLIVLHDTSDADARRFGEIFQDLARRTGGCVLPFDATAPGKLRDLLAAVAVFAVGGVDLLREKRGEMPGALVLLKHLDDRD